MSLLASSALPQLNPDSVNLLKYALGGYVLILLAVSILASRKVQNESDYLVAGRRLPLFLAWGTLIATWFGAGTMFAAAESSRSHGLLGVVLDPFACSATLILAGVFFAKPLWKMELFTMGDFYRQKFGPKAELVGCAIQVPSYFAWVALQYTALSRILYYYFDVDLTTGVFIVAGVTLVYTMIGGMWSVTLTDTLQILVALFGLVMLWATTFSQPELGDGSPVRGVSVLVEKLSVSHPGHLDVVPPLSVVALMTWLGTWATGLFGNIPGQDLQQRVFAAKDARTAAWACILAGILYFAFGMIPVGLGMASLVTHPEGDFDPVAFLAGNYLSPGMLVLFVISVMSMVVSTATSAVLAPATILGHNLLGRIGWFHQHGLWTERFCVVVVSACSIVLALAGESLMGLLDIALSLQLAALFVPVVTGLYGKPRSDWSGVLAMTLGFAAWLTRFLFERAVFPMPDTFDGAYHEYVAQSFPVEGLRSLPGVLSTVPADLYGLGFSIAGYLIGQWFFKARSGRSHA